MEPTAEEIQFAKQHDPLFYLRQPLGAHMPAGHYEVYGERVYKGMQQILTYFLHYVVWINIDPSINYPVPPPKKHIKIVSH